MGAKDYLAEGIELPEPYGSCEHLRPKDGIEETSNPFQAISDIIRGFQITLQCHSEIEANGTADFNSLRRWRDDAFFFYNGELIDVCIIIGLTISWVYLRKMVAKQVLLPLTSRLGILPQNVNKFVESSWKLMINTFMWLTLVYVAFFSGHDLYNKSMELFSDWKWRNHPFELKVGYYLEASYYLHAVYATLFIDAQRQDTVIMVLHHLITLGLVLTSFSIGFLKIGILVLVLDDISDVLLELGKVTSYLRYTTRGYSYFFEIISLACAALFAVSWFVCRIIFHLTKVWRGGCLGSVAGLPFLPVPFHLYFNVLLGALYFFYVYWFWYIVTMVYSLITGKRAVTSAAEDTREFKSQKGKKSN